MEHSTEPTQTHPHVLMAGDSRDVWNIRRILNSLPHDAYGQVFVEVASPVQMEDMPAPDGITVTWLRRDLAYSEIREATGALRGETMVRAVQAWASEWMPSDCACACGCGSETYFVWIGCSMSPRVDELYSTLGVSIGGAE